MSDVREMLQSVMDRLDAQERPKVEAMAEKPKRAGNTWTQAVSEYRSKHGGPIPAKGSDAYNAIKAKYDKKKKKK